MTATDEIKSLYQRRARYYDISANLYYLVGFREYAYRERAVKALDLRQGDTVVELGCGTGLNFPPLQKYIGENGRIIGVDLTPSMLAVARQRYERNGWQNVELIEHDAGTYVFPQHIDGVISTFALTLVPQYQHAIENSYRALSANKHMVVGDIRLPQWPMPLTRLAIFLMSPFGVTLELGQRHPWETMQSIFGNLQMSSHYFGAVYIAMSRKTGNV